MALASIRSVGALRRLAPQLTRSFAAVPARDRFKDYVEARASLHYRRATDASSRMSRNAVVARRRRAAGARPPSGDRGPFRAAHLGRFPAARARVGFAPNGTALWGRRGGSRHRGPRAGSGGAVPETRRGGAKAHAAGL